MDEQQLQIKADEVQQTIIAVTVAHSRNFARMFARTKCVLK